MQVAHIGSQGLHDTGVKEDGNKKKPELHEEH
jgi:hypothetical protein